ncbi:MAG: peptidase S9 family protein [Acidobacteria bacterium]|nr:MAG: peptidase S9 family protein [Acidobacteriota bacterium]
MTSKARLIPTLTAASPFFASLILGLTPSMRAQDASHKLTAMDEFQIQTPADPQISADGKKIVYVRRFADASTDKRYSNLWIINSDGSDHRPLTTGNRSDSSPRWSPDGTRLAYLSDADGKPQIYIRWMDTGQTARITNLENSPDAINWSPDGRMLSFSALVPGKGPHLADLPSPPAGAKWADPPTAYDRLVYRFNGAGYLKPGYMQVFVVSADGGAPRQVTNGNFPNGGNEWGPVRADWTPDSKFLIISANRHPESDHAYFDTEVYEFSVADGALRALTNRKGPDNAAAVSPNGKWIAYTGFDDRLQGHQTTKLYLMNRDGTGSHSISEKLDRDIQGPQWAPDNSGVYFQYADQGDTKIGFCSPDGNCKKTTDHVSSSTSAYGGGSFSLARTGLIAITYGRTDDPGNIAIVNNGAMKVLTSMNEDLFAQKKPGHVDEFWYESSKDKRKIQGWIVHPPDFDASKKYPLILEIHGGPFGDYGDRFDFEKQVWASMGYVVLYTNPRGSTSYGEEFANLIHHAYPGDDYDDLNSGVDAVVAKGYIDTNNLFVTGGSGGGVLTCWTIEHTERFRAAASLYPVINWYSFVLTSDIPFVAQYWFPGNPWDNTEQYMQRSLTNLVAKVKTPTLVMTGEADYRTPISEAEQFYEALKLLNIDTVLVRVPEEPHGIGRRPSHHIAKMLYVAGWFEQHKAKS